MDNAEQMETRFVDIEIKLAQQEDLVESLNQMVYQQGKRIDQLEAMLHKLGFFHFDQLAAWTKADLEWVDRNLDAFKGRSVRENWVGQARDIVKKSK